MAEDKTKHMMETSLSLPLILSPKLSAVIGWKIFTKTDHLSAVKDGTMPANKPFKERCD